MNINLSVLSYKDKIEIDEDIIFEKEDIILDDIKDIKFVHTNGIIKQDSMDNYIINLDVKGKMVLCDSVSLKDIDYDFEFQVDDEIDDNLINNQNFLDLKELLWQNIVLEVPIRFTKSKSENLKGNNWELKDNDDKGFEIDPRLEKLTDYYKGGE